MKPSMDEAITRLYQSLKRGLLKLATDAMQWMVRQDFLDQGSQAMGDHHARASMLGRHAAGDVKGFSHQDLVAGQDAAKSDLIYWSRFGEDLQQGRYDGAERAVTARTDLYALRLAGTAGIAFLGALAVAPLLPVREVRWQLGETDQHCSDCIEEAEQGWRGAASLTRSPADGSTICLSNCRCWLETSDNRMTPRILRP